MKILGKWNWLEIVLLILGLGGIVACFFISNEKSYLSLFASVVGVVSVMFTAKKLKFAPVLSIAYNLLYAAVAFTQSFYGEVIVYLCVLLPLSILTLVGWLKSRKKEEVVVVPNKIKGKEIAILISLIAPVFAGMYFLLLALGTSNLLISTFSFVTALFAAYLLFRRNPFYAVIYSINSIILIVLWTITIINQGIQFLPMVINFALFFVLDIYAIFNWFKEKKQNKDDQNKNVEN